ncbi:MAG: RecQ family ATP-dependent DNA helicase [Chitinophagaceae bacterium]
MTSIESILHQYWGFKAFRPFQKEIIQSVLAGQDTLALLPTGGGKSLCFQLPAMMKEGLCLVVTPLISLMKDQMEGLSKQGIPGLSIQAAMSSREIELTLRNAIYGNFKFLYVSPERLQSEVFMEYLPEIPINLLAVDEAHCISQWGHDFRPAYLRIAEIRSLLPKVPVLAVTATATPGVRKEIQEKLLFKKENIFIQSFVRSNISYSVFKTEDKMNRAAGIFRKVPGSGIVYCRTRKQTLEVTEFLIQNGISADFYHAGIPADQRTLKQDQWIKNEVRVMVATNAFGMGINKPNVRVVVHLDCPESLEAYYQEAGRAGRDQVRAYAVMLFRDRDLVNLNKASAQKFPDMIRIREVYQTLVNYLQVPVGGGSGRSYDFNLADCCKKFRQRPSLVQNVIKILEQEELILYQENYFPPSGIGFTATRERLLKLEKEAPLLDKIVQFLLRRYEGIFDGVVSIRENQIAGFLKMEPGEVIRDIKKLQKMGILDYFPRKDQPQIIFLQARVFVKELKINRKALEIRKIAFDKRISAVLDYVQQQNCCRSSQLVAYFGEMEAEPCGICDICLERKRQEKMG